MFKRTLALLATGLAMSAAAPALSQVKEIPWGTSAVGSAGHKALVILAEVLNREMPKYRITVQPTPGAVVTVKGYATGQFEGHYGSDIAFYEMANDIKRFKGFKAGMTRIIKSIRQGMFTRPRGGVYYSCIGRGASLFGPDSEEF